MTKQFEQAYDNFLAGCDVDTTMLDCAEFMFNAGRESVGQAEPVAFLRVKAGKIVGSSVHDEMADGVYAVNTHPAQPVQPDGTANKHANDVLAPPHPRHFGIPKEHWEAAKYFAEFWEQNNKKPQPVQPAVLNEQLLGAIARGWCHERNKHKVMDSDLAYAIAEEVKSLLHSPAVAVNEQLLAAAKELNAAFDLPVFIDRTAKAQLKAARDKFRTAIRAAEAEEAKGGV